MLSCTINHLPEIPDWDKFRDIDNLRREVLMKAGFYITHITTKGVKMYFPESMAFDSMDEEKFQKVYNGCLNVISKQFLAHISREDFENDILNFY